MNNTLLTKILIALVIGLLVFLGLRGLDKGRQLGSTEIGEAYNSTTTDATWTNARAKRLKLGQGMLGSVVITLASATRVNIWDATSTTDIASTSLAKFGTSVTAGTYIFDAQFYRGLVVDVITANVASTTVTWK